MTNVYESVDANKRRSFFVILSFFLFFAVAIYFISQAASVYLGYEPGGLGFVGIALIISGITSFVSYFFSDKIILSISSAHLADKKKDFLFYSVTENLSIASGLPMPSLYVIEDSAPNAFATGRNPKHAVVCATTGLLSKLNRTELEGVIAHELSHIKNYDILLMSVVSVLVGSLALIGDWMFRVRFVRKQDRDSGNIGAVILVVGIIFAVVSPIIANLIKLAIGRRREFLADSGSAMITKQPSGLISALKKISADTEPLEVANKATAHLFIADPFEGKSDRRYVTKLSNLFATHPPVTERIKALETML